MTKRRMILVRVAVLALSLGSLAVAVGVIGPYSPKAAAVTCSKYSSLIEIVPGGAVDLQWAAGTQCGGTVSLIKVEPTVQQYDWGLAVWVTRYTAGTWQCSNCSLQNPYGPYGGVAYLGVSCYRTYTKHTTTISGSTTVVYTNSSTLCF